MDFIPFNKKENNILSKYFESNINLYINIKFKKIEEFFFSTKNPHKKIDTYYFNDLDLEKIKKIECIACDLIYIDIVSFKFLNYLDCSYNNLKILKLSMNLENLTYLNCQNNNLKSLYIPKNLLYVNCENNKIEKIYFEENSNCKILYCGNNCLKNLNFNKNLKKLYCENNYLTFLEVNNLEFLNCSNNIINKIKINNTNSLNEFICLNNKIEDIYIPYSINYIYLYNKNIKNIYLNYNSYNDKVFIKKLGEFNFSKILKINIKYFIKFTNKDINNPCSICLNNFNNNAYKTRCNHLFHLNCISQIQNETCPLCRQHLFFSYF